MKRNDSIITIALSLSIFAASCAWSQDWSQWRGPNREAKASSFTAPKNWPKDATRKWNVKVGLGDSSPALVGDRLYVFARQDADEIVQCLDTSSGKDLWQQKYEATEVSGPAANQHSGPRSSPAVGEGKVVTLGVGGVLTCMDAASGKVLWRKDDFSGAWPRFYTSSSPIISEGLVIAQLGSESKGGIVAYELADGKEKWRWTGDGTAYASPVRLNVSGTRMIVALTPKKIVGIGFADGKLLWEAPFVSQGRAYNAATPIVDGQTIIYAGVGRGTKAAKVEKTADGFALKELWANPDIAVQFNTPVLKDGKLFGLSQNGAIFCLDAKDGKTLWTSSLGGRGFGSIVDAGPVLLALTPQGELTVFEPNDKEFKKVTGYKVAESDSYAYPVPAKSGIFVKDENAVTLWTFN
jgi:outer membrane protein assembly factor BamB